jgi:hypothetical protein
MDTDSESVENVQIISKVTCETCEMIANLKKVDTV